MTPDPLVLEASQPLRTAALLLFHAEISGAPVVDADGALVGVLSEADLMEREARPATGLGRGVTESWRRRDAMIVGEACSRPARVTAADATLRDAVRALIASATTTTTSCPSRCRSSNDYRTVRAATGGNHMRPARPTPVDLFDTDPSVPMGPGDPRPGRAPQQPSALVIDPDAAVRIRFAVELAADGYQVSTCPGPCTPTDCPARGRVRGQRCPRLPADLALVVVDQASARTRLLDAYASWAPGARVEITGTLSGKTTPAVHRSHGPRRT